MFARATQRGITFVNGNRNFASTNQAQFKVAVCGASGGIGQPLSLLLKLNSLITHLSLYDIAKMTPGVALDLSHISTPCKVTGHCGPDRVCEALAGSDVVVIPAGMPRKPGMTRDDLFSTNASIVRDLSTQIAKYAPKAILAIITNPVNSMVPLATEIYKKAGVYDPKRIFGVTTLDIVRASTFIGEINRVDPQMVQIPVVCGHSGITIIPVISRAKPKPHLKNETEVNALISRIQEAGTQVVKAKAGAGSATLAMAYSGAKFTCSVLRGLSGEPNVIECAFVKSDLPEVPYFANPILLGRCGLEENLGYGTLNDCEKKLLEKALPELKKNIEKGVKFVNTEGDSCK